MKKSIICKEFSAGTKKFQVWCNSITGRTIISVDGKDVYASAGIWQAFNKAIVSLSNAEIEALGEAISDIDIEISA